MSSDNTAFDIQEYMTKGVVRVVTDSIRATARNPREALFMSSFAIASSAASKKRAGLEKKGEHIPPFLIASITSKCNLHCAGCYSRANDACSDEEPGDQLTGDEWEKIFAEADDLGVSFILLAGGEPFMRYDVIKRAAAHKSIMFPVFTNGTVLHDKYMDMLDSNRNIVPVISIEGDESTTDNRRGEGVYGQVKTVMEKLRDRGIIFGVSITVTTQNMEEVYSGDFVTGLSGLGCKAVIYVEYVPVTKESEHLAPTEEHHPYMQRKASELRTSYPGIVFISFPGDEKTSGGCVAAGRGFFHINSHGGAEPCPFSPYSDVNVRDTSIREAMKSPLFYALNAEGLLLDTHIGGCTLHANKDLVEKIVSGNN